MLLPVLPRRPTPAWLRAIRPADEAVPITEILQGSVFYPASGTDGRPVQYLGDFAHSFVYVDCNVTRHELNSQLNTFKGYQLLRARPIDNLAVPLLEFPFLRPKQSDGDPRHLHVSPDFVPYALWAIYDRLPDFGETHGPERFSLLFIGGEGVSTFQSLYYSNRCHPSVIALIKSDAFTGNWTQFLDSSRLFARSVMRNPTGVPDYLFTCDHGGAPPWPWYSKPQHTAVSVLNYDGVTHQRLHLWARG